MPRVIVPPIVFTAWPVHVDVVAGPVPPTYVCTKGSCSWPCFLRAPTDPSTVFKAMPCTIDVPSPCSTTCVIHKSPPSCLSSTGKPLPNAPASICMLVPFRSPSLPGLRPPDTYRRYRLDSQRRDGPIVKAVSDVRIMHWPGNSFATGTPAIALNISSDGPSPQFPCTSGHVISVRQARVSTRHREHASCTTCILSDSHRLDPEITCLERKLRLSRSLPVLQTQKKPC